VRKHPHRSKGRVDEIGGFQRENQEREHSGIKYYNRTLMTE